MLSHSRTNQKDYENVILDLSTPHEPEITTLNFKIPIEVQGHDEVFTELDTDSHISIVSEKYFNQELKNDENVTILKKEGIIEFDGLGSSLRPTMEPISCNEMHSNSSLVFPTVNIFGSAKISASNFILLACKMMFLGLHYRNINYCRIWAG